MTFLAELRSTALRALRPLWASCVLLLLLVGCGDRSAILPYGGLDGSVPLDGSRPCGPATCPGGCCDGEGTCHTGTVAADCGTRGAICATCVGGEVCNLASRTCGTTTGCGPETCAGGCCDEANLCEPGTALLECGAGGLTCASCVSPGGDSSCNAVTHSCQVTMTVCNASTCADGCCTSTPLGQTCISGVSAQACGTGGVVCQNCQNLGETCLPQGICGPSATCTPDNCGGCCLGDSCVSGSSSQACGEGGQQCASCGPSGECVGGGCQLPQSCGPETCGGCCDASGNCQDGFGQGDCGQEGSTCAVCGPSSVCNGGFCEVVGCDGGACGECSGSTCPNGCCDASGNCQQGETSAACGFGGIGCFDCGPTGTCQGGACQVPSCDDGTCFNGCCDQDNVCQPGTSQNACGDEGEFCSACPPGTVCEEGFCGAPMCDSQTCPTGCCDASGNCQAGSSSQACGTGGNLCAACTAGATCEGGSCQGTCSAATCATGCCAATGKCLAGTALANCGTGGETCAECVVGAVCQAGACVGSTCNETTCPNGCCDGTGVCQSGDTLTQCGSFGAACARCSAGAECDQGTCFDSTCDATNCPRGCCDQNGACQPGDDPNACGGGGAQCAQCFGSSCLGGVCQPSACNQDTCNGCCDGSGVCQPGTTNGACGEFGDVCLVCGTGATCSEGACAGFACGPSTCPAGCCDQSGACQTTLGPTGGGLCPCSLACEGCCDGAGACHAGTVSTECGSNGATCQDCTTSGLTCDDDVFPVMCDQSCPSPYEGCATGITQAPPQVAPPGACKATDLSDAATACATGPDSNDCEDYIDAEFDTNEPCAECLDQFMFDFSTFTGIYLCAAPFVSGTCDIAAGCAQDCETQGCETCVETSCDGTAQAGECSQFFNPANACIASSMAATALCASTSYANFGAWIQGVGAHYCP